MKSLLPSKRFYRFIRDAARAGFMCSYILAMVYAVWAFVRLAFTQRLPLPQIRPISLWPGYAFELPIELNRVWDIVAIFFLPMIISVLFVSRLKIRDSQYSYYDFLDLSIICLIVVALIGFLIPYFALSLALYLVVVAIFLVEFLTTIRKLLPDSVSGEKKKLILTKHVERLDRAREYSFVFTRVTFLGYFAAFSFSHSVITGLIVGFFSSMAVELLCVLILYICNPDFWITARNRFKHWRGHKAHAKHSHNQASV